MIRRAVLACTLVSGIIATSASAQERVTAEAFLDMAMGRTLHFHMYGSGRLVGIEQFLRRDLSVWKPRGQNCVYGKITIEEGALCFLYDGERLDEKSCWYTYLAGDRWMVRETHVFGAEVQVVEQITDVPLSCPNAPTS